MAKTLLFLTKTSIETVKVNWKTAPWCYFISFTSQFICLILINIWEELTFNFVGLGNWRALEFKTRSSAINGHNFQLHLSILELRSYSYELLKYLAHWIHYAAVVDGKQFFSKWFSSLNRNSTEWVMRSWRKKVTICPLMPYQSKQLKRPGKLPAK